MWDEVGLAGTAEYMAPEVLQAFATSRKGGDLHVDYDAAAADAWAVGATLYYAATGTCLISRQVAADASSRETGCTDASVCDSAIASDCFPASHASTASESSSAFQEAKPVPQTAAAELCSESHQSAAPARSAASGQASFSHHSSASFATSPSCQSQSPSLSIPSASVAQQATAPQGSSGCSDSAASVQIADLSSVGFINEQLQCMLLRHQEWRVSLETADTLMWQHNMHYDAAATWDHNVYSHVLTCHQPCVQLWCREPLPAVMFYTSPCVNHGSSLLLATGL